MTRCGALAQLPNRGQAGRICLLEDELAYYASLRLSECVLDLSMVIISKVLLRGGYALCSY